MNLYFEQRMVGETTYLILDMDDICEIDSFAMHMMAYNHITNIVPMQIVQRNDKKQAQFDITGMMKLSTKIADIRSKKKVLHFLGSMVNAFEEMEAYMLDPGCLFLEWQYVYLDEKENCRFLYLPFPNYSSNDQIVFLREAVSRIRPDEQERDPYLYDILNAFGRGAVRKLSDFRELLKKSAGGLPGKSMEKPVEELKIEQKEESSAPLQMNQGHRILDVGKKKQEEKQRVEKKTPAASIPIVNIPGREPGKKAAVPESEGEEKEITREKNHKKGFFNRKNASQKPAAEPIKQKSIKIMIPGTAGEKPGFPVEKQNIVSYSTNSEQEEMYESYEDTVIMQEPVEVREEETVLLGETAASNQRMARLIQRQHGFTYWIKSDRMMVGSSQAADIRIDNKAVSRSHAMIVCENGQFYIEDNGSKNGSYIEGKRLQPGRKEAVYHGMVVKFANEEFEFLDT